LQQFFSLVVLLVLPSVHFVFRGDPTPKQPHSVVQSQFSICFFTFPLLRHDSTENPALHPPSITNTIADCSIVSFPASFLDEALT